MFSWLWEFLRRLIRRIMSGCGTANVSITPASGPSGTIVTIYVSGLRAGDSIGVTVGPGTHTIPGADSSGNATITETMLGEPNEVVQIKVVSGSGICEETTIVQFTITN